MVRGNHDDEFKDSYSTQKINSIKGCAEISGKAIRLDDYSFLGLSYKDVHSKSNLKRICRKLTGKVDVVLMHGENIQLVSLLKPFLMIKGGWRNGICMVNDIPSVFTGPGSFTIIELERKKISKISQYMIKRSIGRLEIQEIVPQIPGCYEKFKWVKPFTV